MSLSQFDEDVLSSVLHKIDANSPVYSKLHLDYNGHNHVIEFAGMRWIELTNGKRLEIKFWNVLRLLKIDPETIEWTTTDRYITGLIGRTTQEFHGITIIIESFLLRMVSKSRQHSSKKSNPSEKNPNCFKEVI